MDKNEDLKTNDYLRGIVLNLPDSPGIYQYLNTEGTIIYVGKAKNLKRRVYSYFSKDHQSAKTRILVSKIADIRYIVVKTEEDALLLENNLIKKYKPRYNVLLKDDKTYPLSVSATIISLGFLRPERLFAAQELTLVRTATYLLCMQSSNLSKSFIRFEAAILLLLPRISGRANSRYVWNIISRTVKGPV